VLVAGDAAGLVDPWSREGISFALRSGAMAGHAAAQASQAASAEEAARALAGYADTALSALGPEMRAGRAFMRAFTRHPWAFHMLLILWPPAWKLFTSVISGHMSVTRAARSRLGRAVLTVLSG
jgi:flavin-dependent dehydrogenase